MGLNPDFVGRTYPPSGTYVVGREKIREFATAIGEDAPVCHHVAAAKAAGYADLVAPPTFSFIITFRADLQVVADPELGLDFTRVVHGEQSFAFTRPIVAGDELVVTSTIESIRSMAGNDMMTTRSDVATVDGEHVVAVRSMLVSRGEAEA